MLGEVRCGKKHGRQPSAALACAAPVPCSAISTIVTYIPDEFNRPSRIHYPRQVRTCSIPNLRHLLPFARTISGLRIGTASAAGKSHLRRSRAGLRPTTTGSSSRTGSPEQRHHRRPGDRLTRHVGCSLPPQRSPNQDDIGPIRVGRGPGPAGAWRAAGAALRAGRNRLEPTVAGRVWRQLRELDVVNSSLQFAAVFTLGFIPFLMVFSVVLDSDLARAVVIRGGFSTKAAHDVGMLFTHGRAATTRLSVLGLILAIIGGAAISQMLQAWYAKILRAKIHRWKAMARRAEWLEGVSGFVMLQVVIGRRVQTLGGHIAAASAQFLLAVVFCGGACTACCRGRSPGGGSSPPGWPPLSATRVSASTSPTSCPQRLSRMKPCSAPSAPCSHSSPPRSDWRSPRSWVPPSEPSSGAVKTPPATVQTNPGRSQQIKDGPRPAVPARCAQPVRRPNADD